MGTLQNGYTYVVLMLLSWVLCFPLVSADAVVNFLLTDYGYIYDVMQSTPQDNGQCGIGFGIDFDYIGNTFNALLLNGGSRPYVDVNIPTIVYTGPQYSDFTFRINIRPNVDPPTGTVFHYRSNTCSTHKINELMLWLSNGDIYASKRVGTNTPEVTVLSEAPHRLVANVWQFLGLGVEASTGKLVIMVDSYTFKSDSSSSPQKTLNSPGVIRVGGGFENTMPLFTGGMVCLGMYQELLDANTKHSYTLHNCMVTNSWNSWPNGVPTAPDPVGCPISSGSTLTVSADRTNGFFILAGNGMAPSCHALMETSGVVDVSVLCAMRCLQDDTCLSFTVTTALSVHTCNLYSAVYTDLDAASNTKYYTLTC